MSTNSSKPLNLDEEFYKSLRAASITTPYTWSTTDDTVTFRTATYDQAPLIDENLDLKRQVEELKAEIAMLTKGFEEALQAIKEKHDTAD